jgi:hypothetical protein
MLAGDVAKPFSANDSLIEKGCIGGLLFNQLTGEDLLHSSLSESFFGSMLSDINIPYIQNGPDKNKIVTREEANGLEESAMIPDSEKIDQPWAFQNFNINAEERSKRNRSLKMAVADILQRGIAER